MYSQGGDWRATKGGDLNHENHENHEKHEKHEMTWGWENQNHEWTRMDTKGEEGS